jgi:DNA-binding IclR family transcriptional regulator
VAEPTNDWTVRYAPPVKSPEQRHLVGSLLKGIALVEAFLGGPTELTLSELTRRTGYPTPTVHRLLATLEHAGWIQRGANGGYQLSLRLTEVSRHVLAGINLRDQALGVLQQLTRQTRETAYLVVRQADHAVCVERVESYTMVRIMSWDVGSILPLYAGGAPLALLAFQPVAERERLLHTGPLEPPLGNPLSPEEVDARLAEFRAQGWTVSAEETIPGIASVGAPVFGPDGQVTAAISVGGLSSSIMGARLKEISSAVVDAGRTVSQSLGYRGPYPPPVA